MRRLTNILEAYKLSWNDVRECLLEEAWTKRVNDSLCRDFNEYCAKAAEHHQHPSLAWDQPTMRPRIRACLRFGGELAIAALRIRNPQLRLLPSGRRGVCRYCRYLDSENGRHLIFCPELPDNLRRIKEEIIQAISDESRVPIQATRRGSSAMESYVINFSWPHQQQQTLKKLLVFCRQLIDQYAAYIPKRESPQLACYPVHRVRPAHSVAPPDSMVSLQSSQSSQS